MSFVLESAVVPHYSEELEPYIENVDEESCELEHVCDEEPFNALIDHILTFLAAWVRALSIRDAKHHHFSQVVAELPAYYDLSDCPFLHLACSVVILLNLKHVEMVRALVMDHLRDEVPLKNLEDESCHEEEASDRVDSVFNKLVEVCPSVTLKDLDHGAGKCGAEAV